MSAHKSFESVCPKGPVKSLGIDDTFLSTTFRGLKLTRTRFSPSPKHRSRQSSSGSEFEGEPEDPRNSRGCLVCSGCAHQIVPQHEKR